MKKLRTWAKAIKRNVFALWYAARDSRTPWLARMLAMAVTAYAFSPIDLIPDFIPILGYLDDLIIVPLGIALAIKVIPGHLMEEYRASGSTLMMRPRSRIAAVCIVLMWMAVAYLFYRWVCPRS